MKLADNEKREILRLVEADKPLPDKYSLLLFDDKRDVELVWNGKSNEVCLLVDEEDFERYKPDNFSSLVKTFRKYKDA